MKRGAKQPTAIPASPETLPGVLAFLARLWELNHCLEVASREMLRTRGATAQQRMMLRIIEQLEPVAAGALAARLHVHAGTLSTALGRLERRRMLRRQRSKADARRGMISLTASGRRVAADTEGTVEVAVARVLAATSPDAVASTRALLRAISRSLASNGHGE